MLRRKPIIEKTNCENCGEYLSRNTLLAKACIAGCTFCHACAKQKSNLCPNHNSKLWLRAIDHGDNFIIDPPRTCGTPKILS